MQRIESESKNIVTLEEFTNKDNIKLIWDILIEEGVLNTNLSEKFKPYFEENMPSFWEHEKYSFSLIELDKKYIAETVQFLKNNLQHPHHPSNPQYNKIKIEEEIKIPITFEELQNEKRNKFELELELKQKEFDNTFSPPVPPIPKFEDDISPPFFTDLQKEIQKLQEQRKYDLANVNYNKENAIKLMQSAYKDLQTYNNKSTKEKHVTWETDVSSITRSEYNYLIEEITALKNRITILETQVIGPPSLR